MQENTTWPGWRQVRKIGEGSFGAVYEICREDNEQFRAALKVITIPRNKDEVNAAYSEGMDEVSVTTYFESMVKDVTREISVMGQFKGLTNIVSYEEHQVIPHKNGIGWDILIRMELLTPLIAYERSRGYSLTLKETVKLGLDMCQALILCEKKGIIHRDIKPENIFVNEFGDFVLGDFGIARQMEKSQGSMSLKGTFNFMAPEIYNGHHYDNRVDIYSLGMVLYRSLNANRGPFLPLPPNPITYQVRQDSLLRRMRGEPLPPPMSGTDALKAAVLKAVDYDPDNRYKSAEEFKRAINRTIGEIEEQDEEKHILRASEDAAMISDAKPTEILKEAPGAASNAATPDAASPGAAAAGAAAVGAGIAGKILSGLRRSKEAPAAPPVQESSSPAVESAAPAAPVPPQEVSGAPDFQGKEAPPFFGSDSEPPRYEETTVLNYSGAEPGFQETTVLTEGGSLLGAENAAPPATDSVLKEEPAPAADSASEVKPAPANESMPEVKPAPAVGNAPEVKPAPVVDSAPEVKPVPVVDSTPEVKPVPVTESAAAAEPVSQADRGTAPSPEKAPSAPEQAETPAAAPIYKEAAVSGDSSDVPAFEGAAVLNESADAPAFEGTTVLNESETADAFEGTTVLNENETADAFEGTTVLDEGSGSVKSASLEEAALKAAPISASQTPEAGSSVQQSVTSGPVQQQYVAQQPASSAPVQQPVSPGPVPPSAPQPPVPPKSNSGLKFIIPAIIGAAAIIAAAIVFTRPKNTPNPEPALPVSEESVAEEAASAVESVPAEESAPAVSEAPAAESVSEAPVEQESEPLPEATPEVTPEATPEPTAEATPEPTPEPKKILTLSFDTGGTAEELDSVEAEEGASLILPEIDAHAKKGFLFKGWEVYDGEGEEKIDEQVYEPGELYQLSDNCTLKAVFKAISKKSKQKDYTPTQENLDIHITEFHFTDDAALVVNCDIYNTSSMNVKDLKIHLNILDSDGNTFAEKDFSLGDTVLKSGESISWEFDYEEDVITDFWPSVKKATCTYTFSGNQA